ncbi:MAG TPA: type I phosphomannose isomerase catalytic subunit [Bacteroidales bacterium]|nr:type I phosphomannose isomerase catalytic subunit [Bacteroidales bacterium]
MHKLYPIKFYPVFKEKVWGGNRLAPLYGKNPGELPNCGESWEMAAFAGHDSVVENGFLEGNTLSELIEVYMGDLVGDKVYETFGREFPLLFKFIDTDEKLSVQVHPDDELAWERHKSNGKSEMWYIADAKPEARIYAGFSTNVSKEIVLQHIKENTLQNLLLSGKVKPGDVFYIPAGKVHAIGAGVVLCEIQQASDITYRLYDWNRSGNDGKPRELHVEQALEVIDFSKAGEFNRQYPPVNNAAVSLVNDRHFTTNLLSFDKIYETDYFQIDSFVALVCLEGSFRISFTGGTESVKKGEMILLPAEIKQFSFIPSEPSKVLETFIP